MPCSGTRFELTLCLVIGLLPSNHTVVSSLMGVPDTTNQSVAQTCDFSIDLNSTTKNTLVNFSFAFVSIKNI